MLAGLSAPASLAACPSSPGSGRPLYQRRWSAASSAACAVSWSRPSWRVTTARVSAAASRSLERSVDWLLSSTMVPCRPAVSTSPSRAQRVVDLVDRAAGDAEVVCELADRGQLGAGAQLSRCDQSLDLLAQLLEHGHRRGGVEMDDHASPG